MTRDELLGKLDKAWLDKDWKMAAIIDALRDVVFLHYQFTEPNSDVKLCGECTKISSHRQNYPCETISLIESWLV